MFNKLNDKTAITGLKNEELMNTEKKIMFGGGQPAKNKARTYNINNDEEGEDIKKALEKYFRIEDHHVDILPSNCVVRYLDKETGELKFGGKVVKHTEYKGAKYLLLTKYNQYFCKIRKSNRIFFVRDDEDYKIENEEKTTIHQLYKAGKLKLINDHEEPDMEPADYFDEHFIIDD